MNAIDVFHQTGDLVEECGIYICAVGERKGFIKGEKFPPCPTTGDKTTWRPVMHELKTGETLMETGDYVSAIGEHRAVKP